MAGTKDPRTERPDIKYDQAYTKEPQYYPHKYYEDKLAILVCQISIWKPKGTDWFTKTNPMILRECESIEITDSAKDLINKAVIRIPRGTVISQVNKDKAKILIDRSEGESPTDDTLGNATNHGDVMTPNTGSDSESGAPITPMANWYDDKGLIEFNRSKDEPALLSPNDLATDNRIEIRLGYAYSDEEFNRMNTTEDHLDMPVVFTGFITAISADTPLEIECTNMAYVLQRVSAPNINADDQVNVKDFLDAGSKHDILKDTGIELASSSQGSEITVFGGSITDNLTVADLLVSWAKGGVCCMMETDPNTGKAQLRVGLTYYTGAGGGDLPNNDKKYITYNGGDNTVKLLQFDWDVAQDKISVKNNEKKFLAVEAQGIISSQEHGKTVYKFFKLTVRKAPDLDDEGWMIEKDGQFQVVNKKEVEDKKRVKHKDGTTSDKKVVKKFKDKVDLSKYTVVPYISPKLNISEEDLIKEAEAYWGKYNPNGISGSIEIFGDVFVKPYDVVGLIDLRQPQKNGYYLVDSVHTTFGVNGYRRELKFPFKIATFAKQPQIIR